MSSREIQFRFDFSRQCEKFLGKNAHVLDKETVKTLIADAILTMHGKRISSVDVKRLKGEFADCFRIRKGNIRIIFRYENGEIIVVLVTAIGFRGNVYE